MGTPVSAPHFDLNSMLKLQQDYAIDLTKIPIDAQLNNSNNNAVSNLNSKLNVLYDKITNSQLGSQSVLYKQEMINEILNKEDRRLKDKKANIDVAISGQKRMINLNNNYQKRYAAYTKMLIAFIIGLVIFIFMNKLMKLMPFIPKAVFYVIIIVILGIDVIYIYLVYSDLSRRSLLNYDEVTLPLPYSLSSPADATGNPNGSVGGAVSNNAGDANAGDFFGCVGQDCCGVDQQGNHIPFSPETGCAIPKTIYNTPTGK